MAVQSPLSRAERLSPYAGGVGRRLCLTRTFVSTFSARQSSGAAIETALVTRELTGSARGYFLRLERMAALVLEALSCYPTGGLTRRSRQRRI